MPKQRRRSRGSGSVRKRGKSWQARFTPPESAEISKTFPRKSDAEDWLADQRSAVNSGDFIAPSHITLGEWIDDWISNYKTHVAQSTLRYYNDNLQRLVKHDPDLLDIRVQLLTTPRIQQSINVLTAQYSGRSVHMTYTLVNAALRKAVSLQMIRYNPAADIELPSQRVVQGGRYIPPEDLQAIIAYCKSEPRLTTKDTINQKDIIAQPYKDIILFLARHGCRPGEARALRTDKVDNGWVTIDHALDMPGNYTPTKTGTSRRIPIAIDCMEMIHRRVQNSSTGWLFEGATGQPLQHRNIARHLSLITDNQYTPYDLRHTFCTNAVVQNNNLKAISTITGHSVEMLLKTYVHVDDNDLQDVINSHNGQITDKTTRCN